MMIDDYDEDYDEEFKWFHICITAVGTWPTLMTSAAKTTIIIIVTINDTSD